MNDVALAGRQGAFALKNVQRDPRALIFTVLMPIGFLLLFNSVFGKDHATTELFGRRVPLTAFYSGGIAAYSLALTAFSTVLIRLVTDREAGRLKRYRGTPMPPWTFFAGQFVTTLVAGVLMVGLITGISISAYGVRIAPAAWPMFALYVVLGVFCLTTLAIALAGLVSSTDMASAVGPFVVVILGFVSGVFLPLALLPSWIHAISRFFPLAPLAQGFQAVFTSGSGRSAWRPETVEVLVVWGLVSLVVALRTFEWSPIGARR